MVKKQPTGSSSGIVSFESICRAPSFMALFQTKLGILDIKEHFTRSNSEQISFID